VKNRLMTLAGCLALVAVLGKFYAKPLMAQVRAALVKNVDEKGRNPYQQSGATGCGSGLCDFTFPAVPAGKRLVVEHVSANIFVNTGGVNATFLEGAGGFTVYSLPGRAMATPQLIGVNEQVLAYFEAGQTPFYRVAFSTPDASDSYSVAMSGYLVDLTQ